MEIVPKVQEIRNILEIVLYNMTLPTVEVLDRGSLCYAYIVAVLLRSNLIIILIIGIIFST